MWFYQISECIMTLISHTLMCCEDVKKESGPSYVYHISAKNVTN